MWKIGLISSLLVCFGILGCSTIQRVEPTPRVNSVRDFTQRWDALEVKYGAPNKEFKKLYGQALIEILEAQRASK